MPTTEATDVEGPHAGTNRIGDERSGRKAGWTRTERIIDEILTWQVMQVIVALPVMLLLILCDMAYAVDRKPKEQPTDATEGTAPNDA